MTSIMLVVGTHTEGLSTYDEHRPNEKIQKDLISKL